MENTSKFPRAIILTALPVECEAVRTHLLHLHPHSHPEGSVYWNGLFPGENCTWNVYVVEIGPGNPGAAFETERAVQFLKAHVALFVGVAGGLKDVSIGDVVAASMIHNYESGKASDTFLPRPGGGDSTHRMLHWARFTAGSHNWVQRIKGPFPTSSPNALVQPLAAGEKVLNSTRALTAIFLRKQYSNAVAIEMEGYGFLRAIHANQRLEAIVIRGISDLIDGKSEADATHSQEIASSHASAFAFELLSNLGTDQPFMTNVAKTRPEKGTGRRKQAMVKYSITNSGQMAVGPHSQMNIFHQNDKNAEESGNI